MNVQPLPDKEQSCDVANALSAASLFTRAKKVGGSRLIQPTPVPALRNAKSSSRSDTCSTTEPSHRRFLLSAKTLGNFNEIFFTSEYLTMSEYLTRFPRQISAEGARPGGTLICYVAGYSFEGSPKNSAYRLHRDLPGLTANCIFFP